MPKMVTLTIDNHPVTVPQGTVVVDAAKKIGVDIPVFCYHPKMEPVGMCRLCLVEIGRPMVDRATGQPLMNEDGTSKVQFGPKLETGCTTPVSEGMVVHTQTDGVTSARKDILEFLLTSHPLDCPVCDKGGECPLQNLTMRHGPGNSRFLFDEKQHLGKNIPLGELIYLDRERCIQCARCVRFQSDVVDDPVIGFYNRGRKLEIMSNSTPGFDSIFSGNTTDICPVGALTTADFRFGARPWELKSAASICTHCPVGCNLTINVRREAKSGGDVAIKRIMPRQNESVNEIWICDKGRMAYHYAESKERLTSPLVRKGADLLPVSWDEALDLAAEKIRSTGQLVTLAGGRLSNEDLFNLAQVTQTVNGRALLYTHMAGGDLVARYGLPEGSDLGALGKGDAILVIASDLHQEAPVWWLRLKQAAKRGAELIVLNPRETRLDKFAGHVVRYPYGQEVETLSAFLPGAQVPEALQAVVSAFQAAENAVVFYGSEGLGLDGSQAVAQTAAALVFSRGKTGQPNNGLVAVWPNGNTQGAWDMGFKPSADLASAVRTADVLWAAAVDPAGDDPALAEAVDGARFVIVQELFLSETARRADIVFPAQSFAEREGTVTSGELRVQRYYPAIRPDANIRPDFAISAQIGLRLGLKLEARVSSLALLQAVEKVPTYAGLSYQRLADVTEQWPIFGRKDMYYGGTGYANSQGLGVKLALAADGINPHAAKESAGMPPAAVNGLVLVPMTRLFDRGATVMPSTLLHQRLADKVLQLNPRTAEKLGLDNDSDVLVAANNWTVDARIQLDENVPVGVALVPRSTGFPVTAPLAATVTSRVAVPEVYGGLRS
ncbi:MAG TPA: NADH dehydrogenase (quinone) subunit G [Anaerolineaceae bacterium]|nr:MAG: NADH dehydrogenase (quinone) subunit G [Chloroflexi bacterium GWB2_54_36]HAL17852.1 NADH dehydrogenase (quinone) subunit G [Anaerolineaceae bacterium]